MAAITRATPPVQLQVGRRRARPPRHNLPAQPTPLIGRAQEVDAVCLMLLRPEVRLLTLGGPPGVGKTRLALAVAARTLGDVKRKVGRIPPPRSLPSRRTAKRAGFPDGVLFVPLAAIGDPALVVPAIGRALGVTGTAGLPVEEALRLHLREKRLLLVLDNFEQVLPAAPQVAALLAAATGLKVLVTSRAALRLAGEHRFAVPPLSLPLPRSGGDHGRSPASGRAPHTATDSGVAVGDLAESEAVQLFVTRAQAVQPDFALTPENAADVAATCRRLDGLPLAIELAAARVPLLPPHALLGRLEHRLGLLTGGPRDAPARHQTLHAAIAWSYDLLPPDEQTLFARLSVFASGFTLEAAEAVCGDPLVAPGASDCQLPAGQVLDLLGQLVDKSLVTPEPPAEGSAGPERYRLLETLRQYALEKLAAAGAAAVRDRHLAYCVGLAERGDRALRGPDYRTWIDRLDAEHENLRAALDWALRAGAPPAAAESALRLVGALAYFWFLRVHRREGRDWLDRALVRAPAAPGVSPAVRAKALAAAGWLYMDADADRHRASALLAESAALFRQLGDRAGEAVTLVDQGQCAYSLREFGLARDHFDRALILARASGDSCALSEVLATVIWTGDAVYDQAALHRMATEALTVAGEVGHVLMAAVASRVLGRLALRQGDYARARAAFADDLAITRSLRDTLGIIIALNNLGQLALREGDRASAEARHREALALARDLGYNRPTIAGTLTRLAEVALECGDPAAARRHARESLAQWRGSFNPAATAAFETLAGAAAAEGHAPRALRLAGAAAALRSPIPAVTDPWERRRRKRWLAPARRALDAAAQEAAWAEGQAMSGEQALAYALTATDTPKPEAPRAKAASKGPLTARQREVAVLVACGCSNRQIAAALMVSEHTAENHVGHILTRLGFRSRAQIGAWSAAEGLLDGGTP
jgi:predicted ATPase/DNA-binding CsgD family transcriptional regulator